VGALVSLAVFGVKEALIADGALVRPLGTLEVGFRMTSKGMSMGQLRQRLRQRLT
jgi:hypothetical protein